jgi:AmmeMemoRadiSam system protein B
LEQVCRKAGLPKDAWKEDDTILMTFEGHAIEGRLEPGLAAEAAEAPAGGPTPADVAQLAGFCRQNLLALAQGATPSFYTPGAFDGDVCGAAVTVDVPGLTEDVECHRISARPEVPLQSGLFDLVRAAASVLEARRIGPPTVEGATLGLSVFWDSAMHGTAAEPELAGVDPSRRAVMAADRSGWALAYDPDRSPQELLSQAIQRGRFADPSTVQVFSLAVTSTQPRLVFTNVPRPQPGPAVRQPAVAGRFYPGTADEIQRAVDDLLPAKRHPRPWAGAMVPHAGWFYSGGLAAEVFSRVKIPSRLIIFCPRHGPFGAEWSVAPHQTWSLPGGDVESDSELAGQLAEAVDGLELDAAAHAQEHAIEVQLPIVARLAPAARVVGIAVRGGSLARLRGFADQLAGALRDLPDRPLLVISTDMSHRVAETEARRLDRLALDAVETLDPARLYETVFEHQISMCGVLPAVLVMETLRRLDSLSQFESVGYTTSAEASGNTREVVGYAGMLFK